MNNEHDPKLLTKLKAINRAHAYAPRLQAQLQEIFAPYVGQEIINSGNGQLKAKIKKLLPELPCGPDLNVYRHLTDYRIAWCVKTCETFPLNSHTSGSMYYEIPVSIGDLSKGVLTRLSPPCTPKADYTAEDVIAKRAAYQKAKKAADAAHSDLHPFGEYDV